MIVNSVRRWPLILGLTTSVAASSCSVISPKASTLLYAFEGNTHILDLDTGQSRIAGPDLTPDGWSPSGRWLLMGGRGGIWVSRHDGSDIREVLHLADYPDLGIREVAWLSDRIILLVFAPRAEYDPQDPFGWGYLRFLDWKKGELWAEEDDYLRWYILPSPNGEFWIQRTGQGTEIAAMGGKRVPAPHLEQSNFAPGSISGIAFSPDGDKLAYIRGPRVWVADVSVNGLINERLLHEAEIVEEDLRWSPDGRMLAFQGYDKEQSTSTLRVVDAETGELLSEWPWPSLSAFLLWSPRSDAVLSESGAPFIMDIATGEIRRPYGEGNYGAFTNQWRLIRK